MSDSSTNVQSESNYTLGEHSTRDKSIDMLRVFACCAVVGLHTFLKDTSLFTAGLYYGCGFAVPVFFMASGAFLLNRGSVSYRYVVHKVVRLVQVLLLWVGCITAIKVIGSLIITGDRQALLSWPLEFFQSLLGTFNQSGILPQLWFLWSLGLVYLLVPLFSRLSEHIQSLLLFVLIIIGAVNQMISYLNGFALESRVLQVFRIWIWMKYFLLGGFLYARKDKLRLRFGVTTLLMVITTLVCIAWQMFAGIALIPEKGSFAHAEYFYDGALYLVWVSMLFSCAETLKPRSTIWTKASTLTMAVYMVHPIMIRACGHFVAMSSPIMGCGLGFILVLSASTLFAVALKHTRLFSFFCKI